MDDQDSHEEFLVIRKTDDGDNDKMYEMPDITDDEGICGDNKMNLNQPLFGNLQDNIIYENSKGKQSK